MGSSDGSSLTVSTVLGSSDGSSLTVSTVLGSSDGSSLTASEVTSIFFGSHSAEQLETWLAAATEGRLKPQVRSICSFAFANCSSASETLFAMAFCCSWRCCSVVFLPPVRPCFSIITIAILQASLSRSGGPLNDRCRAWPAECPLRGARKDALTPVWRSISFRSSSISVPRTGIGPRYPRSSAGSAISLSQNGLWKGERLG